MDLRRILMVAIVVLLATPLYGQDRVFDTEVTADTNLMKYLPGGSQEVFMRKRGPFRLGWNWNGPYSNAIDTLLGIQLNHHHVYGPGVTIHHSDSDMIHNAENGTQFIISPNRTGWRLQQQEGYGKATRADFEIQVDSATEVSLMETDTNTAAVHGFRNRSIGTVTSTWLELRGIADTGVISGNTNSYVLDPTYSGHDKAARWSVSGGSFDSTEVIDLTRNGQFVIVGLAVRRVGGVDSSVNGSDPVLKLRVRRQQRRKSDAITWDAPDEADDRLLTFSLIPDTEDSVTLQVGRDTLPLMFYSDTDEWDSKITDSVTVGTTTKPRYEGMPLNQAVSSTSLTGRELVWRGMRDVRDHTIPGTHDLSKAVTVTAAMLQRLEDDPTAPGLPDTLDSHSQWTLLQGLLVFDTPAKHTTTEDGHLLRYPAGMGASSILDEYDPHGQRGQYGWDHAKDSIENLGGTPVITDLLVEVEYFGNVNVDLDYVILETPNGRAILRDQHRTSIEGLITDAASVVYSEGNPASTGKSAFGLFTNEERGEDSWLAMRYINLLTRGVALSEMNHKPLDRFTHVVYPWDVDAPPDSVLPLWVWNETSHGRVHSYTGVPFMLWGDQGYEGGAFGLKYGAAVTTHKYYDGDLVDIAGTFLEAQDPSLTHWYELWDRLPPHGGGTDSAFMYSQIPLEFWQYPKRFEEYDTDADSLNDYPSQMHLDKYTSMHDGQNWAQIAMTERGQHNNFRSPGNEHLLYGSAPWLEQVWAYLHKDVVTTISADPTDTSPYYVLRSYDGRGRPMTAEEFRVRLYSPTLLGADGQMIFHGSHSVKSQSDYLFNQTAKILELQGTPLTAADLPQALKGDDHGRDYPILFRDSTGAPAKRILIDTAGGDSTYYYVEGYLPNRVRPSDTDKAISNFQHALWLDQHQYDSLFRVEYDTNGVVKDSADVKSDYPGFARITQCATPTGAFLDSLSIVEEIYFGARSCRNELLRYAAWLNDSLDQQLADDADTARTVRELLGLLDLTAWVSLGYYDHTSWRGQADSTVLTNPLADVFVIDSIRTRHPYRYLNHTPDYEARDSTFLDVTLHAVKTGYDSTTYDQSSVYLGLQNRRTNSLLVRRPGEVADPHNDNQIRFMAAQDFYAIAGAGTNGHQLYDQLGSRTVRLPFNYTYGTSESGVNFRITEVGVGPGGGYQQRLDTLYHFADSTDTVTLTRMMVDTVIGVHDEIEIDLLPGEGRLFRVMPIAAAETASRQGYLDHSNQRKMVAYPKALGWQVVTDSVDNRTYYRQINGDTLWYHRVYHRRRDDSAVGGTATQALSVYYQRSEPLLTGDSASGAASYAFHASTVTWQPEILVSDAVIYDPTGQGPDTLDASCGYPSVVVRMDTLDVNYLVKAYVVFGCEYDAQTQNPKVLIAEAVLPAEVSNTEQHDYVDLFPAEVLETVPAPNAPILEHWGTPMINASSSGNYYCWSHGTQGIGVGYKTPDQRRFQIGQSEYIALGTPAIDLQTHPSMNSYSRLHIGEDDPTLVWQLGPNPTNGTDILYTRLKHTGAGAIYHELTADPYRRVVSASDRSTTVGTFVSTDPTIAVLTGTWVTVVSVATLATHGFPVVYRNLSDWDMDTTSEWFELRQVNHNADRVYWETWQKSPDTLRIIGRRAIDIEEWSINTGGNDTIAVQTTNFIFSDSLHLRGPDAAQGEQHGETYSNPANLTPYFDDSTNSVAFWSETYDADPYPVIWHMLFGWDYYHQEHDHAAADLVSVGLLRATHDGGRFAHLAARHTMNAFSGWQSNRRIFNPPGGTWDGTYLDAPQLSSSSEYFFKEGSDGNTPHGFVYRGVRGTAGYALLGPVWVESQQQWVSASSSQTPPGTGRGAVATPWMRLSTVDDIAVMTRAWSDDDIVGTLFIERRSDGQRLNMNAVFRNQDGKVKRMAHTVLSDPQEQYRFILMPQGENLYPAQDVEITFESNMSFAKGDSRSIIDLRTMGEGVNATDELMVYPNPAHDDLTIVVNLEVESKRISPWKASQANATIRMFSLSGASISEQSCMLTDVLHVDLSTVPSGIYTVQVTTSTGTVLTRQVSVVH